MYVCMPADRDSVGHSQRIVTAELFLRRCPPEQISHATEAVAGLVTPLCQDDQVDWYHLSIQRHHSTQGHFVLSIGTRGRFVQHEIPRFPGARAPAE
ncbi:hypothetical protein [Streptomyces rubiginosohelvolus]|uniref:hypothetical protein n=1 Tax=Streptomyces rubiginosohelvolus TaxID=67362 RepID=UPI0036807336